jgi:3-hydroxyacyl-CoA dehydrogenase
MGEIGSVAVIGAGVMGASIAAHAANAGVDVLLVDIVKPGAADRNAVSRAAIEKLKKMEPAPLMGRRAVKLITPGNIEDDLAAVGRCDWIVEAVVEKLEVKQALYLKLDAVRKEGAVVSSNTSTIPLRELTAWMAKIALPKAGTPFYRAKLGTARFYMQRLLPQTGALLAAIEAGAAVMMEFEDADF